MNSAKQVDEMVEGWKAEGKSKAEIVWSSAEACLGWPYAWGALGQDCTPSNRRTCMNRSSIPSGDAELIRKRCQVLNGSSGSCADCKYYPGGERTEIMDCRGFTRRTIQRVGITIQGAGATSQYNTASNWTERGLIKDMPKDKICCVFQQNQSDHKTMEHTGLALGDEIIHCSVEVKRGHTYDKGWTHYAVPKGIDGDVSVPAPTRPTLRRGSSGEYVTWVQTKLIQLGYNLQPYGADGKFGAKTEAAVKDFQRDHDLNSDGIVGPKTYEALDSGKIEYFTVTVKHVSKGVANSIITAYGGTMTAEEV